MKKIYIKLWLGLKPYNNSTVTDSYYLKLANEICSLPDIFPNY